MKLSEHFTLAEFTKSATADAQGISNNPTAEHLPNLKQLAAKLEEVRLLLGSVPMLISSGYRSSALNRAVGGVLTSDHCKGLAADFSAPKFGSVEKICMIIKMSDIEFDQVIFEQGYTSWVHLGVGQRMRRQVLSWSSSKGYVNGVVRL